MWNSLVSSSMTSNPLLVSDFQSYLQTKMKSPMKADYKLTTRFCVNLSTSEIEHQNDITASYRQVLSMNIERQVEGLGQFGGRRGEDENKLSYSG